MKDKFLQLIQALMDSMGDLKTKVNGVIAGLPPVEQHEAAGMVTSLTRELGWVIQDIERTANSTTVTKVDEMLSTFKAEVIAEAIADKTVISADELGVRIEAAQNETRTQIMADFKAAAEKAETITARRATIVTDLGDVAASLFTDDMIIAENFDAELARAKAAVELIKEKGIDAEKAPKAFAFVSASILKSEAEFNSALELAVEAAAKAPAQAAKPTTPAVTVHAASGKPDAPETKTKLPALVKPY